MSDQLFRPAPTAITKVKDVPRENGVRLYCYQHRQTWSFQVRGPIRLANGKDGQDFIVATAYLGVEDLEALREAIDREIAFRRERAAAP